MEMFYFNDFPQKMLWKSIFSCKTLWYCWFSIRNTLTLCLSMNDGGIAQWVANDDYSISLFLACSSRFWVIWLILHQRLLIIYFFIYLVFSLCRYFYIRLLTIVFPVTWRIKCYFVFSASKMSMFLYAMTFNGRSDIQNYSSSMAAPDMTSLIVFSQATFSSQTENFWRSWKSPSFPLLLFCQVVVCPGGEERWTGTFPRQMRK